METPEKNPIATLGPEERPILSQKVFLKNRPLPTLPANIESKISQHPLIRYSSNFKLKPRGTK